MAKGHAVIGRYRIVRQKVSIFALAGALLLYPSRAFFDNLYKYSNNSDTATPPHGRHTLGHKGNRSVSPSHPHCSIFFGEAEQSGKNLLHIAELKLAGWCRCLTAAQTQKISLYYN